MKFLPAVAAVTAARVGQPHERYRGGGREPDPSRTWFHCQDTRHISPAGGHVIAARPAPLRPGSTVATAQDVALGAVVILLGLAEAATSHAYADQNRLWLAGIALAVGIAAGFSRRAPSVALGTVWAMCVLQIAAQAHVMLVELSITLVAFGCARWGRVATVWASGVSIPLAAAFVVVYVKFAGVGTLLEVTSYRPALHAAGTLGTSWGVTVATFAATIVGLPWLAGLALRFAATARVSARLQEAAEENAAIAARETAQAREIADLREQQARLARDVHDVVGHSLAVILAQAESAQYLPDGDAGALRQTMANIATSARSSLQEVHHVLSRTGDRLPPGPPGGLGGAESLIEGMRASGYDISYSEVGTIHPMLPELDVVAFRVLQEMLTNAIKHGRRGAAITVTRGWRDGLQIEVGNIVGHPVPFHPAEITDGATATASGGHGLDGMRRRLESVGGRLETQRAGDTADATFTATAWMPVPTAT